VGIKQPTDCKTSDMFDSLEKNNRTESENQLRRFQSSIADVKLPMSNFFENQPSKIDILNV